MNKVCVYTAIAGAYDEWLQPHPDIPGVDFIAFSDRPLESDYWRVISEFAREGNPRAVAKSYKILGPQFEPLEDYDATLWIDANMEVISPTFVDEALADLGPDGFALHSHSYRDDIYDEAEFSATMPKYDGQPLLDQAEHYWREGIPHNGGLWSCASMARARSAKLDALMNDWWAEILRWTLQDQISLPYVLHKHGITPKAWPHYPPGSPQAESPWLKIHRHVDGT